MAQLVVDGQAAGWDLAPLRWTRFREGDLLPPASGASPPNPKLRSELSSRRSP